MISNEDESKKNDLTFSEKISTRISLSEIIAEDVSIIIPELADIGNLRIRYQIDRKQVEGYLEEVKSEVDKKLNKSISKYLGKWAKFNNTDAYSHRLAALYKDIGEIDSAISIYRNRIQEDSDPRSEERRVG